MTTSSINRSLSTQPVQSRSILNVDYAEQADIMFAKTAFYTALCGYAITLGWGVQALLPSGASNLLLNKLLTFPATIPADIAGALVPIGIAVGIHDSRCIAEEEQEIISRIHRLLYTLFNIAADCCERHESSDDYAYALDHIKTIMDPATKNDEIDRMVRAYADYRKRDREGQVESRIWTNNKASVLENNKQFCHFINLELDIFAPEGSFRRFCQRTFPSTDQRACKSFNLDQKLKRNDDWSKCEVAGKFLFNLPGLAAAGYGLYSLFITLGVAVAMNPIGVGLIISAAALAVTCIATVCLIRASKAKMNREACMSNLKDVLNNNLLPRERANLMRVPTPIIQSSSVAQNIKTANPVQQQRRCKVS